MIVLVDSWYSKHLDCIGQISFDKWLKSRDWNPFAEKVMSFFPSVKGLFLLICSLQANIVVTVCDTRGFWAFLTLLRLFRRKPCFVLEFIRREPISPLRKVLYPVIFRLVMRPAVRNVVTIAQVMTREEKAYYARMFRVDESTFIHIPFPMLLSEPVEKKTRTPVIMSSGRQSCDWATLLAAAGNLPEYTFLIIHSKKDIKHFGHSKVPGNCQVLCDISQEEHDRLLEEAALYVIPLLETKGSSGHARLSHAVHFEVPVIITDVFGIKEYVVDGETALVVPPKNPSALSAAISKLMVNRSLAEALARNAKRNSEKWTWEEYFAEISRRVNEMVASN
jgi:glycosyltransferase involved in cell wall biosynthesis